MEPSLFGTGPAVTFLVGKDETFFSVHRDLICDVSPFFKAAFMGPGGFKEAWEQSMTLPEDNADAFEVLVRWLYCKRLDYPRPQRSWELDYLFLARLDVLADKYDIKGIRNEIIDAVFECQAKRIKPPCVDTINLVYSNSTPSSSMRKLFVGIYAWHIDMKYYLHETLSSRLHQIPDFAVDLAIALGKRHCAGEVSPFRRKRNEFYYKSGGGSENEIAWTKLDEREIEAYFR